MLEAWTGRLGGQTGFLEAKLGVLEAGLGVLEDRIGMSRRTDWALVAQATSPPGEQLRRLSARIWEDFGMFFNECSTCQFDGVLGGGTSCAYFGAESMRN